MTQTRWLTILAIAAVAAVNGAGIYGIAVARRASRDEATRLFAAETQARAKVLERTLADTRADLDFLAASSALGRLGEHREEPLPAREREVAESALLVFLRGHAEAVRLAVRSEQGAALLLMGRRGGVPVLWVAVNPTGDEGAAMDPSRPRVTGSVDVSAPPAASRVRLETELSLAMLLSHEEFPERRCRLTDARGALLARQVEDPASGPALRSEATFVADGWSAASPWTLACVEPEALASALVEPLAARYRATLGLNLAAMVFALVLGFLVVRETARRERIEAQSHEELRVRELERQLFHAERLTTVGRLAAGIAHEINNPLEGMANYLSLARSDLAKGDLAATARRLDSVGQGLDRAAGIVRQVLAHADPAKAPKTPVDLNQILAETVEFVRSRPEFGGLAFETELMSGRLMALGSPIMLGQVASNLVINACEAQPRGGEVRVRSAREGEQVMLEVADRGPGVAEADRERIFEPFFSTKDSTGLGLSVCHSIVRQHGGELLTLARPGGGAIFRMILPAFDETGA